MPSLGSTLMELPNRTELRRLTHSDAPACDAIIATLPYHFGNERGVEECARAVRQQAGFVATINAMLSASSRSRTTGRRAQRSRGWPSAPGIAGSALAAL